MEKTQIIPVHHISTSGNTSIDVIMVRGELFIRLTHYRNNIEFLTKSVPTGHELFGGSVFRDIEKAIRYCEVLSVLLDDNLNDEQKRILQLIPYKFKMKKGSLIKEMDINEARMMELVEPLVRKKILTSKRYYYFHHDDPWKLLRDQFDELKNQTFLMKPFSGSELSAHTNHTSHSS